MNKEKRKTKQQLRKNKQKVIKICNDCAFKGDCMVQIIKNTVFSEGDLNNISLVCKFWFKILNDTYNRIKSIEYIYYTWRKKICVYYCFASKDYNIEHEKEFISVCSKLVFTKQQLPENDCLYMFCKECHMIFTINHYFRLSKICKSCKTNNITPRENISKTGFQIYIMNTTANLK